MHSPVTVQLGASQSRGTAISNGRCVHAETVVLVTEHNQPIARLFHDYLGATLNLAFVRTVPFIEFDAEIHFKDGTHTAAKHLKIKDQEVILLKKTTLTEEDIEHVVLSPQELLTTSK